MKKTILLFFFTILTYSGYSQEDQTRIYISNDLAIVRLAPHVWMHVSYHNSPQFGRFPSNGMILVNGDKAWLFDTPMTDSLTGALVSWLTYTMRLKIQGFTPNHWHNDCMGGLAYLQNMHIPSLANQLTIDIARNKHLPIPDKGFIDSVNVKLGDTDIFFYYPGPAHSTDNIAVWIPSEKVLFAGCMVKSMNAANLGNTADGDLSSYPSTLTHLLERFPDAQFVIPGHGASGGLELIRHTLDLANKAKP